MLFWWIAAKQWGEDTKTRADCQRESLESRLLPTSLAISSTCRSTRSFSSSTHLRYSMTALIIMPPSSQPLRWAFLPQSHGSLRANCKVRIWSRMAFSLFILCLPLDSLGSIEPSRLNGPVKVRNKMIGSPRFYAKRLKFVRPFGPRPLGSDNGYGFFTGHRHSFMLAGLCNSAAIYAPSKSRFTCQPLKICGRENHSFP